jgi:hypothetical protein
VKWHEYGRGAAGYGTLYADPGLSAEYIRKYIHPHCRNSGGVEEKLVLLADGALLLGKSWPLEADNSGRAGFMQVNVIARPHELGEMGEVIALDEALKVCARAQSMTAAQLLAIPREFIKWGKRSANPRPFVLLEIARRLAAGGDAQYVIGSYSLSQDELMHVTMFTRR